MSQTQLDAALEAGLIRQAQQGDRRAYTELVRAYRSAVIGMLYRMCGDLQLAEDAAQDAFVRAWQHLPRYQPRGSFRGWLYRIAVNRALDVLRRERPTEDVDAIPLSTAGPGPEAAVLHAEQVHMVQAAILRLPPACRSVLVLREYEGLSYHEIADVLGIPPGTVMSRLSYARARLAESLQEYMEVE